MHPPTHLCLPFIRWMKSSGFTLTRPAPIPFFELSFSLDRSLTAYTRNPNRLARPLGAAPLRH